MRDAQLGPWQGATAAGRDSCPEGAVEGARAGLRGAQGSVGGGGPARVRTVRPWWPRCPRCGGVTALGPCSPPQVLLLIHRFWVPVSCIQPCCEAPGCWGHCLTQVTAWHGCLLDTGEPILVSRGAAVGPELEVEQRGNSPVCPTLHNERKDSPTLCSRACLLAPVGRCWKVGGSFVCNPLHTHLPTPWPGHDGRMEDTSWKCVVLPQACARPEQDGDVSRSIPTPACREPALLRRPPPAIECHGEPHPSPGVPAVWPVTLNKEALCALFVSPAQGGNNRAHLRGTWCELNELYVEGIWQLLWGFKQLILLRFPFLIYSRPMHVLATSDF